MKRLLAFAFLTGFLAIAFTVPALARDGGAGVYVDQLLVKKSERKLFLMGGGRVLRSYNIDLGFTPRGHKRFQGDGRTPEGTYYITHRNPQSAFHLSLGISYPNDADRAYARGRGKSPGGDIFIHGRGPFKQNASQDWTAGCIAVTDAEMEEIFRYVRPGVPITIRP